MEDTKKSEEMRRYEQETGKKAIWRGRITESFKKWKKGEKIYEETKERITILIDEESKEKWQNYAQDNEFSSMSNLIRNAVNFFIDVKPKLQFLEKFPRFSHDIKEPLTTIKGFSQILLEKYSGKLDFEVLLKLKDIYSQSEYLENKINDALDDIESEDVRIEHDVLIVEDDLSTIKVLESFFKANNYSVKGVITSTEAFDYLENHKPKLILLDILLSDSTGYKICKSLRKMEDIRDIPIYYITAVPESEVKTMVEPTGANGVFYKPFNFSKFEELFPLT